MFGEENFGGGMEICGSSNINVWKIQDKGSEKVNEEIFKQKSVAKSLMVIEEIIKGQHDIEENVRSTQDSIVLNASQGEKGEEGVEKVCRTNDLPGGMVPAKKKKKLKLPRKEGSARGSKRTVELESRRKIEGWMPREILKVIPRNLINFLVYLFKISLRFQKMGVKISDQNFDIADQIKEMELSRHNLNQKKLQVIKSSVRMV